MHIIVCESFPTHLNCTDDWRTRLSINSSPLKVLFGKCSCTEVNDLSFCFFYYCSSTLSYVRWPWPTITKSKMTRQGSDVCDFIISVTSLMCLKWQTIHICDLISSNVLRVPPWMLVEGKERRWEFIMYLSILQYILASWLYKEMEL